MITAKSMWVHMYWILWRAKVSIRVPESQTHYIGILRGQSLYAFLEIVHKFPPVTPQQLNFTFYCAKYVRRYLGMPFYFFSELATSRWGRYM